MHEYKIFAVLGLLVAIVVSPATAEEGQLLPKIPAAKGEQCVEPTDVMRRQHMEFIMHQRDLTVHDGIRTKKHQFVRCINCHVRPNEKGEYPRHTSNEHFCTTCHVFASVSIDCFQCHADRPTEEVSFKQLGRRAEHAGFLNRLESMVEN